MLLRPLIRPPLRKLLRSLLAPPVPITQMDFISNLFLQRGIGPPTYTRPTIGTEIDRLTLLVTTFDIDEARFGLNGLLMEGASNNPLLFNEEIEESAWAKADVTISVDQIVSPDGAATADLVIPTAVSGQHAINQNSGVISGTTYTQKFYVKSGGYNFIQITGSTGFNINNRVNLNLITGELGFNSLPSATVKVTPLINDWFELCMTTAATSTSSGGRFTIAPQPVDVDARLPTFTGDGVSGVHIWRGQLEPLAFGSSSIKTIASPVSRGEDTLSYDAANIPTPTENYTVSMEVDILGLDSTKTQTVYNVDGETSRKIEINTTTGLVEATHGAVTSTSTTALVPGTKVKIAFTVGAVNQTLYINGVQEDQDVKGTVTGTATAISICNAAGLNQLFGHSKFNKIFAQELTPDEVANL